PDIQAEFATYHECSELLRAVRRNMGRRLTRKPDILSSPSTGGMPTSMTERSDRCTTVVPSLLVDRPGASDEARADILKAAATAFNERGYDATSIDDVADLLGASKGRIYHYYRSKADIFLDLHLEALRVLMERVRPIANRADLGPAERVHEMCLAHAIV